ncbi:MAG: CxxC-x17-CxxC domain-containing protein [Candidatus Paceibacterota bacterium]|jgi:CxxC-x17-CxxC domain-containing protein
MRNFNQGGASRFSGGNRGGGSRFGGGRPGGDRGPVTMHQAICSKCGKECEVPFRPTGDKPIYCNDCFSANRDRSNDRGGDRFPRKDFGSRPSMRPSFNENRGTGGSDEVKKQLEFLGLKIDRLTKVVENLSLSKAGSNKEKSAQVKEVLKDLAANNEIKIKAPAKKAVKKAVKKVKV